MGKFKRTTNNLIGDFIKIHGDKYDYSKTDYKDSKTKVCIICPEHGEFWQLHTGHLKGLGCPKCKHKADRLTQELFILECKLAHEILYDYSKTLYKTSKDKITVICPTHGEFELTAYIHLRGADCPKCAKRKSDLKKQLTLTEFLTQAHLIYGNRYSYDKTVCNGSKKPVIITCPEHGDFIKIAELFLQNQGCQKCAKEKSDKKLTKCLDQFIKEVQNIHNNFYDYSLVLYTGSDNKINIICPRHGVFMLQAGQHLLGRGCPKCTLKSQTKVFERLCEEFPEENLLFEVGSKTVEWLDGQRLDIYFPKYNIAVEYDGRLHYEPVKHFGGEIRFSFQKEEDARKELKCQENNCKLFRLRYDYSEDDFTELISQIKEIIQNHGEDK